MKDYIERAAVEAMLENAQIITDGEYCGYCTKDVSLDKIPAADVVEVVRCKECINHSEVDGYHYCQFWRMYCPDDSDFFCKAGQ